MDTHSIPSRLGHRAAHQGDTETILVQNGLIEPAAVDDDRRFRDSHRPAQRPPWWWALSPANTARRRTITRWLVALETILSTRVLPRATKFRGCRNFGGRLMPTRRTACQSREECRPGSWHWRGAS
jgi:hypothetical protein